MILINLEKRNRVNADTIVIDGFLGCGKSLLFNLMPAFKNLIKTKFIPDYEDFHILREQNLINKQTAKWYIDNLLDRSIYKSSIGRETNLRWDDDSGLKNSINIFKEFKLLFSEEGDNVIKKIEEKEIAQSIWTHNLSLCNNSLKELISPNIFMIELIRNPIFVFKHYENFLKRYDISREFTPSYYFKGKRLPWYTYDYKESLENRNVSELAIICIINSYKKYFNERGNYIKLSNFKEICLEELIFSTENVISKIESFIGRKHDDKILKRILRNMNIPRKNLISGVVSGTEKLNKNVESKINISNDQRYCNYILEDIDKKISHDLISEFKNIFLKYQKLFPFFTYNY